MAMSLSLKLTPVTSPPQTHLKFPYFSPKPHFKNLSVLSPSLRCPPIIRSVHQSPELSPVTPPKTTQMGKNFVHCSKLRGPTSYSLSLGLIMLAMGLTLEIKDLISLFMQRPLSILFGFAAQYTIMPAFGVIISKTLGLPPSLSVGLILLSCCPGGTASNVVTLIAQGDVPLSIVMTMCTTLGAVLLTPLLTKSLAGTYVPIDAVKLSISTLQVVVTPVLLGSYMQSTFPSAVKVLTPFAPLFAVLASSLLACSVFSENVVRLKSSVVAASLASDLSPIYRIQSILSGELGVVMLSVVLLHFTGFFVGYLAAAVGGFKEQQRRAISIEVGMQNSSLGVVLATAHFTSSMAALPPAMSAVIMNIMGSCLGFIWRYIDPSDSKDSPKIVEK
ncbi:hypothetical protein Pint_23238 [Pistacia integerrima]|uniref:Uncharacterized protein n=1 Tax=Pistacia integerrima TaxID=434235 RepID=A0ACC0YLL2_9ROSI|nr:hypothetical protein Pint_23238 [Pistacia integerrima]